LFGTDPKLPVDLLLPAGQEDPASNNGEWLTLHQNRLRDAHQQAQTGRHPDWKECSPVATLQGEQRSKTSGTPKFTKSSIAVIMSMKLSLPMVKDPPELSIVLSCKSAPNPSRGYHHGFHQELAGVPQGLIEHHLVKVLATLRMTLMISSLPSEPLRTLYQFQLQNQKDHPCVVLPGLTRDNMQTPIVSQEQSITNFTV